MHITFSLLCICTFLLAARSSVLKELDHVNLTKYDEFHMYVIGANISVDGSDDEAVLNMSTRYYCWSSEYFYPDEVYALRDFELEDGCGWVNDTEICSDLFGCGVPGPVWEMYPGQNYTIILHNYLYGIGSQSENDMQGFKDPDITNIHVHGLHVSPLQDNIVDVLVNPLCPWGSNNTDTNDTVADMYNCNNKATGDSHIYNYSIPSHHYPGSHWFHAHWHGSTTLHVSGGIAGAINVLPIGDEIMYEPNITSENDHNLLVSFVYLVDNSVCLPFIYPEDSTNASCSNGSPYVKLVDKRGVAIFDFPIMSTCYVNCKIRTLAKKQYDESRTKYSVVFRDGLNLTNDTIKTFVVNGQYQPTLTIETGEWHRLRLVNTNMGYLIWQLNNGADIDSPRVDNTVCQSWFISTDGVFFEDGPRSVYDAPYYGSIVIPPGGRGDIELICFKSGTYSVIASSDTRGGLFTNAAVPFQDSLIMYVEVTGDDINGTDYNYTECSEWENSTYNSNNELQCTSTPYEFSPYLKDTTNDFFNLTGVDPTSRCLSDYNANVMSQCSVVLERVRANLGGPVAFNGHRFSEEKAMFIIATNVTHEFLFTSNFHPFHQHTWPFQLQRDIVDGWLAQRGDWRDTLGGAGSYIGRSNLYNFHEGKLVQHCHFVPHEDHGMMAFHTLKTEEEFEQLWEESGPLQSNETLGKEYSNPSASKWVSNSDCEQFYGTSVMASEDINTYFFFYLKKFTFGGYCWLGIYPTVWLRNGNISNAWFAFAMFGDSYQKNFSNATMSGEAFVWSLEAAENTPLYNLKVNEVSLQGWQTNITKKTASSNTIKCQDRPTVINEDIWQFVQFYCVRPLTTGYKFVDIEQSDYSPSSGQLFNYIWAYGEGRFYQYNMHASRGACGMHLLAGDGNYVNRNQTQYCIQEGIVVSGSTPSGVESFSNVQGLDAFLDLAVNSSDFIEFSQFDKSDIPSEDDGLKDWEVALIVIGGIIFLFLVVYAFFCYHQIREGKSHQAETEMAETQTRTQTQTQTQTQGAKFVD